MSELQETRKPHCGDVRMTSMLVAAFYHPDMDIACQRKLETNKDNSCS